MQIAILVEDLLYLREGVADKIVNVDIEKQLARLANEIDSSQFVRIAEFLRTIEIRLEYVHLDRITLFTSMLVALRRDAS